MDVMKMNGRAGLQQYVSEGVGVVITTQCELLFVKSLLSAQLPIESHLAARLVFSNLKVIGASGTNDGGAARITETYNTIECSARSGSMALRMPRQTHIRHLTRDAAT